MTFSIRIPLVLMGLIRLFFENLSSKFKAYYNNYITIFKPFYQQIKTLLLGIKCALNHEDLQMFGLKLNMAHGENINNNNLVRNKLVRLHQS